MPTYVCKTMLRVETQRANCFRQRTFRPQPHRRGGHKISCVLDVTQANFSSEVLQSKQTVLVDFWATWCGPCKLVAPSMVWIAKEYEGLLKVVKVEADPNPALIEEYKVYGLPTFVLFKDGQVVDGSHWEGALTRKQLVEYLQKHGVVPAKVDA